MRGCGQITNPMSPPSAKPANAPQAPGERAVHGTLRKLRRLQEHQEGANQAEDQREADGRGTHGGKHRGENDAGAEPDKNGEVDRVTHHATVTSRPGRWNSRRKITTAPVIDRLQVRSIPLPRHPEDQAAAPPRKLEMNGQRGLRPAVPQVRGSSC